MSLAQGSATESSDALAQAHARLVGDPALQFEQTAFEPPQPPPWLGWIGDALVAAAPVLKIVFWIGCAALALGLLYVIVREVQRLRAPRPKPDKPAAETISDWRPSEREARDLLASADALAGQGKYAEAAHLLLLRGVQDFQQLRPRAVPASLTTREIATLREMPEAAKPAFSLIGRIVERSLFGGQDLTADDFTECRRAYEAFALPIGKPA